MKFYTEHRSVKSKFEMFNAAGTIDWVSRDSNLLSSQIQSLYSSYSKRMVPNFEINTISPTSSELFYFSESVWGPISLPSTVLN